MEFDPLYYRAAGGGVEVPNSPDESFARELDARDPLARFREDYLIPRSPAGQPVIYFCGNSLGLQPRAARSLINEELDEWAGRGVDGHFHGLRPWYGYHELFRDSGARLVGALPGEVVMMNTLTVNLHLMIATFYRPTRERYKILVEYPAFPSDTYAVKSQLALHGFDPADVLVTVGPRTGEHVIRSEDTLSVLQREGDRIALVLLAGVNFFTGQVLDMAAITAAAHRCGCTVGWDLAHAAGNVPLALHDWSVDFAVWCNYKYLNSGPGAVAGCFVHEKHGKNLTMPRLAGWWGNDPDSRFLMHLLPDFVPREGADGWQVSNPPIFSLAPVKASLDIFEAAGIEALRSKSVRLTGFLRSLIDRLGADRFEIITPREESGHGCQLSILVGERPRELFQALQAESVICDFREPNVIRVAPVPLYNTFLEAWKFVQVLGRHK